MSRLVSAFQDKVVDRYNIRKPKKAAKKFRQFVEKLVARAGEQCPAPNRCGKMNKHWRPYISRWRHFVLVSRGDIVLPSAGVGIAMSRTESSPGRRLCRRTNSLSVTWQMWSSRK